jgi:hypothetical protein
MFPHILFVFLSRKRPDTGCVAHIRSPAWLLHRILKNPNISRPGLKSESISNGQQDNLHSELEHASDSVYLHRLEHTHLLLHYFMSSAPLKQWMELYTRLPKVKVLGRYHSVMLPMLLDSFHFYSRALSFHT